MWPTWSTVMHTLGMHCYLSHNKLVKDTITIGRSISSPHLSPYHMLWVVVTMHGPTYVWWTNDAECYACQYKWLYVIKTRWESYYIIIRGSETKWCLSGEQINIISCFRVEWPCLYHLSFQSRLLHVHVPRFKWSVYGHGYMVFGPLSATGVDHPLMILAHYTHSTHNLDTVGDNDASTTHFN